MNSVRKALFFFLVIMLVAGGLAFNPGPAKAATCTLYHTVQPGETLYLIGLRYGYTWKTLADINNLSNPSKIYAGSKLCVADTGKPATYPSTGKIPTFSIVSVKADETVTIRTYNFPAHRSFDVLMGEFGTRAVKGKLVEVIDSGKGGSFTEIYIIPKKFHGDERIAIRLEANDGSGYYAYNWFYNNTSGGAGGQPPASGYKGYPTFSIVSVVRNQTVTIRTNNLPPGDEFTVTMGAMGTRGINGIKVASTASGKGGAQTLTYQVPAALKGAYQIAIRMQSPSSGYFAYNWFYNSTTP